MGTQPTNETTTPPPRPGTIRPPAEGREADEKYMLRALIPLTAAKVGSVGVVWVLFWWGCWGWIDGWIGIGSDADRRPLDRRDRR